MTKLTLMDLKSAIFDKNFRELFPEYKEKFDAHLKNPGCACNMAFLRTLLNHKDRLKQYFPTKEIVTPEEEEKQLPKNNWGVINCPVDQLEDKLKALPKEKRLVAAARFKDRVTVVINDAAAYLNIPGKDVKKSTELNWQVINTTKDELINELINLEGRKAITLTRWKDQITAVVSDIGVLF